MYDDAHSGIACRGSWCPNFISGSSFLKPVAVAALLRLVLAPKAMLWFLFNRCANVHGKDTGQGGVGESAIVNARAPCGRIALLLLCWAVVHV
jgi:hypothetical protein